MIIHQILCDIYFTHDLQIEWLKDLLIMGDIFGRSLPNQTSQVYLKLKRGGGAFTQSHNKN